jgi:acyl-CoA synthetase (AMP-forming)/AMP-acid ligase II
MELLSKVLETITIKYGDRILFDSLEKQMTFKHFYERTRYLGYALLDLGAKKGDRIAILAENSVDYLAYHFACSLIGAILLPLNIRHTSQEMAWMINDAQCSVLIVDSYLCTHLDELTCNCPCIHHTIGIGKVEGTSYLTDNLAAERPTPPILPSISPDDPLLLIYTSGTTGRPKGALQTNGAVCIIDELTAEEWQATENDIYLAFMPFFHQAGLLRARATMLKGGKVIVAGKLSWDQVFACLIEKNVTIAVLPYPYNERFAEFVERKKVSVTHLRLTIGLGGVGTLPADRTKRFCRKFGCEFMGVYGQTETSGPIAYVSGDDWFKNPFTCGKPRKGMEVAIWDENNAPLLPGMVGEIMVRSKTTIPGYWANDEANRVLYTDGWLHTGDLGRFDKDGFLYFVDRKKELVKTGGENVYPKEVEEVLVQHPSIKDIVVMGLPDPKGWGEIVTAVVVPETGLNPTLEEIQAFCKGKIAGYKIPKVLKTMDSLPINITGKVNKLELREKFTAKSF